VSFLQIMFLLGTLAVAGPIAAHLLARPRYKRVPFTMLRFLRTGEIETQSRRRLRNFLILILRCTVVVLVAFFFAGPERILAEKGARAKPVHVIGIDDSLSMAYGDQFAHAVDAAKSVVEASTEDTRFSIVALASGAAAIGADAAASRKFLDELKTVPLKADPRPFLSSIDAAMRTPEAPVSATLISDFTPAMREALRTVTEPVAVNTFEYKDIVPEPPLSNVALLDARVLSGSTESLTVVLTVANYGDAAAAFEVVAKRGEAAAGSTQGRVEAHAQAVVQMALANPGFEQGYAALEFQVNVKDGLEQDNRYYLGLGQTGPTAKHVLVFAEDEREGYLIYTALHTLAGANALNAVTVQLVRHSAFSANLLGGAGVVIFASAPDRKGLGVPELADFVRAGGRLIAFAESGDSSPYYARLAEAGALPATPVELQRYALQLASSFNASSLEDPESQAGQAVRALHRYGLDTMPVAGAYALDVAEGTDVLWPFSNGQPFLCHKAYGRGASLLVNTSADDSLSPLMKSPAALAFLSFLIGGSGRLEPYAYAAGEPVMLPAAEYEVARDKGPQTVFVISPSGASVSAAASGPSIAIPPMSELGWVRTQTKPLRFAGINVPRGETDLSPASEASLDLLLAQVIQESAAPRPAEETLAHGQERKPLWRLLAWTALGLMLADVFLSNRVDR
jgi:hypothetical protein